MANIINEGGKLRFITQDSIKIEKKLKPCVYSVKCDLQGFFLDRVDALTPADFKVYGNVDFYADRIIKTFNDRKKNTGVLLSGEKGSGKTLLAKIVCDKMQRDHKVPVVLVNEPYHGDSFNTFIQLIDQPCILFFDEYEKVYFEEEANNGLLTLMDGVYTSEKLFLLTSNNSYISPFMENRPGRIFYSIEFSGVDQETVVDYLKDNLKYKDKGTGILTLTKLIRDFNFDMLVALVEDINRYNISARDAVDMLNIKNVRGYKTNFDIKKFSVTGKFHKLLEVDSSITINPFYCDFEIAYESSSDEDEDYSLETFNSSHLVDADIDAGKYTFINDSKSELVLEKTAPVMAAGWESYVS